MNRFKLGTLAVSSLLLVGGSAALMGCNASSTVDVLSNMTFSIVQQGSDQYFDLTTTVNLGNVSLAAMTVGILNPNTGDQAGEIQFTELANGESQISLMANTNLLPTGDLTLGNTLPNGLAVPAVLGATNMVGIKVANNSILYLGGSPSSTAYVGLALGIPAFDTLGSSLSIPVNLFFQDQFNTSLLGVAGVYTSKTAGENGVAFFGKYTAPASSTTPVANVAKVMTSAAVAKTSVAAPAGQYSVDSLNDHSKNQFMNYFYGKKRKVKVD